MRITGGKLLVSQINSGFIYVEYSPVGARGRGNNLGFRATIVRPRCRKIPKTKKRGEGDSGKRVL